MSYLPTQQRQTILGNNSYIDWRMENGSLWAMEKDLKHPGLIIISSDVLGFKNQFSTLDISKPEETNKLQILTTHQENILLKDVYKPEMLLMTRNARFTIAGENFLISPYNNWWLIWSPWELWSYSEGGDPMLLTRSGEYLHSVVSLDKYNALALIWAQNSTALYPYYLVTHAFINHPITSQAIDSKNRIFYFSAKVGQEDGLWSLKY